MSIKRICLILLIIILVLTQIMGCKRKDKSGEATSGKQDLLSHWVAGHAGLTALHMAAFGGNTDEVEALLEKGADVNCRSKDGKTALHLAAATGHTKCANLLIAHGADIEARDKQGSTPLAVAAVTAHPTMVELLLSHGAKADTKDNDGKTPLARTYEYIGSLPDKFYIAKERTDLKSCIQILREHNVK